MSIIKKINKIKELGIFSNYSRDSQLPDFKRYNLIYGLNYTGKTTLSRLFEMIEKNDFTAYPNLEYEIEDELGTKYRKNDLFNTKIRVFNQEYIDHNMEIRNCKAKTITLILGDENKEIVQQIGGDQESVKNKLNEYSELEKNVKQNKKYKDKTFTDIARTIYEAIMGGAIRTYNRNNAEIDYRSIARKQLLSEDDLENQRTIVRQNVKPVIDKPVINSIELVNSEKKQLDEAINYLIDQAKALLQETVESQIIERLKNNADISIWVETGLNLHSIYESKKCEFCEGALSENRLKELTNHFNKADKQLKQKIDNLSIDISTIRSNIDSFKIPDKARFYDEIQNEYQSTYDTYKVNKDKILDILDKMKISIDGKKLKTTEKVNFNLELNLTEYNISLNGVFRFINIHNSKTNDFESEKNKAINKLKEHYLSTIYDEVKNMEKEIEIGSKRMALLINGDTTDLGIDALKKRIVDNQTKISSTHKACEEINRGLSTFLGRDELVFEPHRTKVKDGNGHETEIEDGYIIKRNGKLAKCLSEGEKTAIAFVYFIIHLKDYKFSIEDGIIVIDDPISSLDANSLFQAFSFLKNAVISAKQVFVFTHNFDFMRLLLNWLKDSHIIGEEYFMIKNGADENKLRVAYIDKLDKLLKNYETEYQYLFSILRDYQSDQSLENVYNLPNIARKFMDSFLAFRVPCLGSSSYKKLERINYDKIKKNAIYKFANHESHMTGKGFDPSLVPETDKVIPYLLDMIKTDSPDHYGMLEESLVN
ncbi:MAG: AAA family ATPase [Endomicrobiales bacterium]|nr:AAA family ATPase [Endomicrobiales bacterium]